ncbi:MAG: PhoU domain-containing protein [Pseudomonadota bacterium]
MSHYQRRLEADLDRLRSSIRDMGNMVTVQLDDCATALFACDHPLANRVTIKDAVINRQMREIDELCYAFIARHIPTGGLLRLVASSIRVNIQLERVGDYLVTIARCVRRLSGPPTGIVQRELRSLVDEASRMFNQSLNAFVTEDDALARATGQMHAHLEHTLDDVYEHLFSDIGSKDNREIMSLFVIFNMLKRIADQAKNLSEQTIFAATGETKAVKKTRILFVDQDQRCLAPMAAAIAQRTFGDWCDATSAGRRVGDVHEGLEAFLSDHGSDLASIERSTLPDLAQDGSPLVISLEGKLADYFDELPFHTAGLEWPVSRPNGAGLDEAYREIAAKLHDLMDIIGEEKA